MQGVNSSQRVSVAIIGRSHASEFRDLVRRIQDSPDLWLAGQFETINEALIAGVGEELPADIAVVLQAFSDEYSVGDSSQLIGRMLFRRVLCCYGPWCVSDGRTHEIWPIVSRVSVASAWQILEQEIRSIRAGVPALLPMAAAEEVFAQRVISESDKYPTRYDQVLIVSDDGPLRKTIAEMLQHTSNQVFECGSSVDHIQRTLDNIKMPNVIQCGLTVLLDIDGQETRERALLELIRSAFPMCDLIRLTSFPQAVAYSSDFSQVIDKLEAGIRLTA